MFSSISEYFFGASTPGTEPAETQEVKMGTMSNNEAYQTETMDMEETEDDWVLVDVTNDDRLAPTMEKVQEKEKVNRRLEESWFVTPPPCFTASGHTKEHLTTSPMEDLLIEHPSMSVYVGKAKNQENRTPRRKAQRPKQVRNNQIAKRCNNLRVRQSKPQRAAAVAARLGIQSSSGFSIEQAENAKKVQRKQLSRNKLDKQNKNIHQQSIGTKRRHHRNTMKSPLAFHKQPR